MKTTLPTSHLHPLSSSQNGSYHFVAAETVGKATIHALLNAVKVTVNSICFENTIEEISAVNIRILKHAVL